MLEIPEQLKKLQEKILLFRRENKFELQNGDVGSASAPSNIALLKYWGKKKNLIQIPDNSSLSYTLGGFRSWTKVSSLGRFFPENEANLTAKFSHKFILKNENNQIIEEQISGLSPFRAATFKIIPMLVIGLGGAFMAAITMRRKKSA